MIRYLEFGKITLQRHLHDLRLRPLRHFVTRRLDHNYHDFSDRGRHALRGYICFFLPSKVIERLIAVCMVLEKLEQPIKNYRVFQIKQILQAVKRNP